MKVNRTLSIQNSTLQSFSRVKVAICIVRRMGDQRAEKFRWAILPAFLEDKTDFWILWKSLGRPKLRERKGILFNMNLYLVVRV